MYDLIGDNHGHADELMQLLGASASNGTTALISIPNGR